MSMIPEVMIREKLIRRVGGVVDSRPTRPLREDKCLLPWVEVLSQNINGTRSEDGGDLMFASIYLKQRANYLAVMKTLRASLEPSLEIALEVSFSG